jgi:4-hydroxy-tetrahydrodipicolinate reductase
MNIALIGYGKMGHTIEQIATERGHQVVLRISSANRDTEFTAEKLKQADVAIEFTKPEAARDNVLRCLQSGLSVVCGTTGWNEDLPLAHKACTENNTAFLHASNFSIGVNIFFELNKRLAKLMNAQPAYKVSIEEIHHTAKLDAPSGTAISLAEQVVDQLERTKGWQLAPASDPEALPITALREDAVPGTHRVSYSSEIDDIEIIHTAHSRQGFALGAVLAAEFLAGKKGVFSMQDVLGI